MAEVVAQQKVTKLVQRGEPPHPNVDNRFVVGIVADLLKNIRNSSGLIPTLPARSSISFSISGKGTFR